jgi:hypothetical protein
LVAANIGIETKLTKAALLGYAKVDFLALQVRFGRWNSRRVDTAEVRRVADSMRTGRGIIRYLTKTMVPLVVRPDEIDRAALSQNEGTGADDLPFLSVLKSDSVILAAGGQHRRLALELLREDLRKEINGLTRGPNGQDEEVQRRVKELKGDLVGLGFWGVAVYDFGVWSSLRPLFGLTFSDSRCLCGQQ